MAFLPARTSVLMPAFNAEATIEEAVASVLAQTIEQLELIVVDDASDEPVENVLRRVRDPRLRIIRHARNRDVSAARNTALATATAPLVSQLDADDGWEPSYLESILPCFADPQVGLAYANAATVGCSECRTCVHDTSAHPIDRFPALAEENPIPALTVTMRTHAVRAVGGYSRWLWGVEDYHLYLKLARAGWRFAFVDAVLARYRWPAPDRGRSYDNERMRRNLLRLRIGFGLRHPLTVGPGARLRAGSPPRE